MPYDWDGFTSGVLTGRYPYEVLYDDKGVCGEKSKLLAYILKELGYGVVLFDFELDQHQAVGIKCPVQYSQYSSGYCFIESTSPSIITDNTGEYIGAGELSDNPEILKVSDGVSFDSVEEEYNDSKEYQEIIGMNQEILPSYIWQKWKNITDKYGFVFD